MHITTFAAAAFIIATPFAAGAQTPGTYSGFQANGAPISLTVEAHNDKLYLSGFGVGITTTCPDGEPINENVGVGFEPKRLQNPHFVFKLLANPELYIDAPVTFDNGNNTVSGTVTTFVPALDTFTGKPKKSETCKSSQSFTATLGQLPSIAHGKPKLVIY
jgi:hypothetical protein